MNGPDALSPARTLGLSLIAAGAFILLSNRASPDESRVAGVAALLLGAALACPRPMPGLVWAGEMLAVLLLVLAGGEVATRHENNISQRAYEERLMRFVGDPALLYEMKPFVHCGGDGVTNERGMLDGPRSLDNPEGALRVACLGDSVGGDCSLPRDNACAALERGLGEARGGKPTEVLNFSVPGYNTPQEARALEVKVAPFHPDAVVVLFVMNDAYDGLAISHFLPGNFKFEHLLYSGARLVYSRLVGGPMDPFGGVLLNLYEGPTWGSVLVSGFDQIQRTAASLRAPVVVAIFPIFVDPPLAAYERAYQKIAREAERHGFVAVNLAEAAFAGEPVSALLKPSRDLIHPNAHAHHLAAAAIQRALLAAHPDLVTR